MRRLLVSACLAIAMTAPAAAAISSSRSASVSAPKSSSYKAVTSSKPYSYKPYSSTSGSQRTAATAPPARKSLLQGSSQPSPKLTQVIREKESNGPGWIGTAVLIAMLSQHDLSAHDRQWIQGQIKQRHDDGDPEALLQPLEAPVAFKVTGIDGALQVNKPAKIAVSSLGQAGKDGKLSCTLQGHAEPFAGNLVWTPKASGVYLLSCSAGAQSEQWVVRVADVAKPAVGKAS